jgi:hypothetical protein
MARKPPKSGKAKPPAAKPARAWPELRWDWVAAAFSLLLLAWLVTEGDWNFFPQAGYLERFYDGQARSLLHGRIDVPPEAIQPEAFVRNGKTYGYFGPTPALARIPFALLGVPERWNRVSMLLASALLISMLLLLLRRLESAAPVAEGRRLRRLLAALLILAAAIGSTNCFVSSEAKVYQESAIWAGALVFAQTVSLICYLMNPRGKWLALSCAAAFLAFFTRVSSGAGPVFSLLLVDVALLMPAGRFRAYWGVPEPPSPRVARIALTATLVATASLWGALNYWKFGEVFASQPVALSQSYRPGDERALRIKGTWFSLANLPLTLENYLSPSHIEFARNFPWVFLPAADLTPSLARRFPQAHFDHAEPFASLPPAMPELFLAALAGTVLCLGRRRKELPALRAPICGALAGCGLIFAWGTLAYRYLHDTFPWLVAGSAIAVAGIPAIRRKWLRYGLSGLFAAATAYAMWTNFAFAIVQQRVFAYPLRPEKGLAFADAAGAINAAGLGGFLKFIGHWREYIPADSFQGGNLLVDKGELVGRDDQPVVRSAGPPPYGAEYAVQFPADGDYELAVRYASAESRPVRLFINEVPVRDICRVSTGGWSLADQRWVWAGVYRLPGGPGRIGLTSSGDFPYITMLRLVRVN